MYTPFYYKLGLIKNMDHMRISGTEPSSKNTMLIKSDIGTLRHFNALKLYESTEDGHRIWLHLSEDTY